MRRVLLVGWTVAVLAFLYIPILLLVGYSFNASRLNATWGGFTLRWYADVFRDHSLTESLENSLIVAVFTTALAVPLGTAAAWALYRYRPRFARSIQTLTMTPIVMPEVIMGVSLLIFFATIASIGNRLLARIGAPDDAMGLGFVTIILGHVTFCFPFVMVAVRARLAGLDPALEEAAMDLGAGPARAFLSVIVPYLLPAIVAGALMSFTLSMDELIVTYFTYGPGTITLPVKVYGMARVGMSPTLNALSAMLIVATAVLMSVADFVRRRGERK